MKRMVNLRKGVLGAAAAAALLLGSAAMPGAQTVTPSSGGQREGIKVHGDWTIDIRHPDGRLASHHEFHNDLVTIPFAGSAVIAGILGRFYGSQFFQVHLEGATPAEAPCLSSGQPSACVIVESSRPAVPGLAFNNLVVNVPSDNGFAVGTLELTGTATAGRDAVIGRVGTSVGAVAQGQFRGPLGLTTRPITLPPVVAGQIIQVKVTFSFS